MWSQYDYIFAFGLIFSFIDAYGIGANDVANSFATSVSSHSLTLFQAVIAAGVMEFLGAVLAGSRVTDAIRNKIIDLTLFDNDPAVLMLAMWCALVGSSLWLIVASNRGWPVSTTHSISGAIIGVGIATTGSGDGVDWSWEGTGGIFAGWGIAPAVAAVFGAITYLIIRYGILERENSTRIAIWAGPAWFFVVSGVLTMTIVWKGAPNLGLSDLPDTTVIAAVFGTAAVVAVLAALFWVPFVYARVIRGDYTIRFYHFALGPLLWSRTPPADASEYTTAKAVPDYYRGHHDNAEIVVAHGMEPGSPSRSASDENSAENGGKDGKLENAGQEQEQEKEHSSRLAYLENVKPSFENWYYPKNLVKIINYYTFGKAAKNMTRDVASLQLMEGSEGEKRRLAKIHAYAKQYPNQTEHAFSFLQVMTACTMSFAHGSNDISNAIAPLSTIFLIWDTGAFESKAPVPIWILVYGAIALVIGFATYGYRLMSVMGNKITLHSPTRGFSMELGGAITTILATRLSLPVSTTQTITGAIIAVGLVSNGAKGVSWRRLAYIFLGWVLTLPAAGIVAGCLYAIIINAPRFGFESTYQG